MLAPQDTPTSLYRYFDTYGVLLYVGITSRGASRNRQHNLDKSWWQYVSHQEVEHFPTRSQALAAERAEIIAKRPPFNRQHNPDHELLSYAYCAVADNIPDLPEPTVRQFRLVRVPSLDSKRLVAFSAGADAKFAAPITPALLPQVPVYRDGEFIGPVRAIRWSGPSLVVQFEPRVGPPFNAALATTKWLDGNQTALRISRIDVAGGVVRP